MKPFWRFGWLALAVLLVFTGAGCGGRTGGKAGPASPGRGAAPVVPFLFVVPEEVLGQEASGERLGQTLWIGRWDVARGTVSFDPRPLCTTQCAQIPGTPEWTCRSGRAWDGGKRVVLSAACLNATFSVTGCHPDYSIEVLEPPMDPGFLALNTLPDGAVAGLGYGATGLQVEMARGRDRTVHVLNVPFDVNIPLGVFAQEDALLGVLGSVTRADSGVEEFRLALFELGLQDAGGKEAWHAVAVDQGFHPEIRGPGAVMLGGRVYLPGSGRVGVMDLTSCRLAAFAAADEACRAWLEPADPTYLFTSLGAYQGLLLVEHRGNLGGSRAESVWAFKADGTALGRLDVTEEGARCLVGAAACGPASCPLPGAANVAAWPAPVKYPSVVLPGECL